MRRLAATVALPALLAFTPLPAAAADSVSVLSGEHGRFTRLAMKLDGARPWRLGRDGAAYVLRLEGDDVTLDASRVYSRIGRKRIAGVASPRPGELRIDLACDCRANAFEERPGLVVIDIFDGRPDPESRFEAPLPAPAAAVGSLALDDNPIRWHNLAGEAAPAAGTGLVPNIALALAREELLSRLSRAAAQGVVEMKTPIAEETETPGSPLLRVQTVMDRDLGARRSRDEPPPETGCIADERVAVSSWAGPGSFTDQIGPMRLALSGEFDRPDPEAITRLARFYLHYGLGAEARALLTAFPEIGTDRPLLLALAAIVEGTPERAPRGVLAGQGLCEGPVALWALLSEPAPGLSREIARGAILRSLPDLPPELRREIGPELARRFLERDDQAAAQEVSLAMARVRRDAPAGGELLTAARLDAAAGREAPEALAQLASGNAPESPEALLMLVDASLARGRPVDPALVATAGSLAFELRNSSLAPRLARAEILGLGSSGAFEAAYAALDALPASRVQPGLAGELLSQLAAAGTDESFLRYALRPDGVPAGVAPDTLGRVATRLLDLGFPTEARSLLARPGLAADPLLAARAALEEGDARAALQQLAGAEDAAAAPLRARALERLGDFAAAGQAWQTAGEGEAARRSAWRAGDWATLLQTGQPEERALAARFVADVPAPAVPTTAPSGGGDTPAVGQALTGAAGPGPGPRQRPAPGDVGREAPAGGTAAAESGPAPGPTGVLARNRALVAETQQLRAELDAILRLHQMPD